MPDDTTRLVAAVADAAGPSVMPAPAALVITASEAKPDTGATVTSYTPAGQVGAEDWYVSADEARDCMVRAYGDRLGPWRPLADGADPVAAVRDAARPPQPPLAEREPWLRGPMEGVPPLLQPLAHALQQAREDARGAAAGLPAELLWARPAGVASVGFHLRHVAGVLDRLLTYARGEALTRGQLAYLAAEGSAGEPDAGALLDALDAAVDRATAQLRATDERTLTEPRAVGRAALPSTVAGLLTHAAEHAQRHVGQLLVTARVARAAADAGGDGDAGGGPAA